MRDNEPAGSPYDNESAAPDNIDYRTGPLSDAEVDRCNVEHDIYGGRKIDPLPIDKVRLSWSKEKIRAALGLPEVMPDD